MRIVGWLLLLALVAPLWGCDQKAIFEKFVAKEEAAFSEAYLNHFIDRDFEAITAQIHPQLRTDDLRSKLEQVAAFFPQQQPKGVEVIGSQTYAGPDWYRANMSFQYEFANAWLIASVALEKVDGAFLVTGVNVQPIEDSLENLNAFSLAGKGIKHYAMLGLTIAVPVFIFISLVACIKSRIPRRKWLWILFVLMGFVQFKFDWASGALGVMPLSFQLLGAGYTKASPYAPVVLSFSVPAGAIVFWLTRGKGVEQGGEEGSEAPEGST